MTEVVGQDIEEEDTGIDWKYHLTTLLLIIGAAVLMFLTNYQNPDYSDMKLGEALAPVSIGIIVFRWLTYK